MLGHLLILAEDRATFHHQGKVLFGLYMKFQKKTYCLYVALKGTRSDMVRVNRLMKLKYLGSSDGVRRSIVGDPTNFVRNQKDFAVDKKKKRATAGLF